MDKHFHVKGEERKRLVKLIAEVLGEKAKYLGVPSCAYQVGAYKISKDGEVTCEEEPSEQDQRVLEACKTAGFQAEEDETQEEVESSIEQENNHSLTIELPREQFTDEQLENLQKLVHGKESLFKQALAIEELPVQITDEKIIFPWFPSPLTAEEATAYTQLIAALGEMAKTAKRVTMKEKEVENPKYTFRCFLLRLGFIGKEYKQSRKILLKNLTGSAAFKSGVKRRRRVSVFPSSEIIEKLREKYPAGTRVELLGMDGSYRTTTGDSWKQNMNKVSGLHSF